MSLLASPECSCGWMRRGSPGVRSGVPGAGERQLTWEGSAALLLALWAKQLHFLILRLEFPGKVLSERRVLCLNVDMKNRWSSRLLGF